MLYLTDRELSVVIKMINSEQFDGARYRVDYVDLTELRDRIKEYLGKVKKGE